MIEDGLVRLFVINAEKMILELTLELITFKQCDYVKSAAK